ncbi:hypothetical protein SeMB42_g05585 [Synchytrium endobioticum]|uniref:SEC7 domain-containing protein n=1 Tax=Synchytrium endobioticum TaxID=286115 RepID=A0A507CQJ1_9FUNG|nr:hypothetical protein SeMB42_g05585 [Synchytrium endobioticum]
MFKKHSFQNVEMADVPLSTRPSSLAPSLGSPPSAQSLPPNHSSIDMSSTRALSTPIASLANTPSTILNPRPALAWYHIIHGEIVSVVSAMRKNQRWSIQNTSSLSSGGGGLSIASSRRGVDPSHAVSMFDYWRDSQAHAGHTMDAMTEFLGNGRRELIGISQEHRFSQKFSQLKARLATVHGLKELDPRDILSPFLEVICSGDATGPITGAALNSVEKFITYGILDPKNPALPSAMSSLVHAVTHCKFEATDAVSDEVVLDRILRLLRVCVVSEAGQNSLDDKGICEMVEAAFGMCFQSRVSELLRRAAEHTLVVLVQALFERLKNILMEQSSSVRASVAAARHSVVDSPPLSSLAAKPDKDNEQISVEIATFAPYGLPAILELLRVLITLVDPRNRAHTDSVHRVVALTLLVTAFEVGGCALGSWVSRGVRVAARWQGRTYSAHRRVPSVDLVRIGMEATGRSVINVAGGGHNVELPPSGDDAASIATNLVSKDRRASIRGVATVNVGEPDLVDLGAQGAVAERTNDGNSNGTTSAQDTVGSPSPPVPGSPDPTDTNVDDMLYDSDDDRMAVAAKDLVTGDLCRYLFQLLSSTNMTLSSPPSVSSLTLLSLVLKVISSMFLSAREYLRLQQEWFLGWLMQRVDGGVVGWDVGDWQTDFDESARENNGGPRMTGSLSSRDRTSNSTSLRGGSLILVGEVRELLLETLVQMTRQPTFFADLYVNYDGDMLSQYDLYEEIIRFLSKHSFPDATPGGPVTTSTHQALALEGLLLFLHQLVDRRYVSAIGSNQTYSIDDRSSRLKVKLPTSKSVLDQRNRKRVLMKGAQRFNHKPAEGIRFLQEHGFLPIPADPAAIATFLKTTPGVSKKLLGEYFGKPANVEILKAFVKQFEFAGCRIDEALRLMLESFRLPGESQQIERIMDVFAETYFNAVKDAEDHELEEQSSAFVLAYSIIMLNTDQHSPQVRRRMTFEDFTRNNRGINNGKNFSQEYLKHIFDAIRSSEVVMPEEHEGDLGFSYVWKELMKKVDVMGNLLVCRTNMYDKDMIMLEYNPLIAALGYAFDNAEDDLGLQRAVVGFHQLATIAAHYHLPEVFDNVIMSLSRITGLSKDGGVPPPPRDIRRITKDSENGTGEEDLHVKVDRWAVEFGRNLRGQVAAVLMFNLAAESGSCLKEGWKGVAECLRNLFLHSLLPLPMIQVEDFVRGTITIPRRDGILSTFAQLLSLGSGTNVDEDEDAEPSPDDIDAERCTLECIRSCRVEDLFADSRYLEDEALVSLVKTLKEASKQERIASVRKSKGSPASDCSSPPLPNETPMKYHAASIFFLEQLVNILIQNRDRLSVVWPVAVPYFMSMLESPSLDPVLLERAVVGVLRLATRLVHKEDMGATVLQSLHLLRSIPLDSVQAIAVHLMAGLLVLIKTDNSIFSRNSSWDGILPLLTMAATHPEAARYAFDAASALIPETFDVVLTPQNFGECVDFLISFSTAAGVIFSAVNSNVGNNNSLSRGSGSTDRINAPSPRFAPAVNGRRGAESAKGIQSASAGRSQLLQDSIDRATKSLDKLYKLHVKIPKYVECAQCSPERAWFEFWLPVFSGLGQQCYHPCREIRQYAMTLLQRALLSPELEIDAGVDRWSRCFDDVLFPLLDELLKPEAAQLDLAGVDETRMRASALLCKIFLHSLHRMYPSKSLSGLWTMLLQYLGQFASIGSDYLREGVLESLKNMLLVMSTQGVFQSTTQEGVVADPSNGLQPTTGSTGPILWDATWQIVGKFEPNLKNELFPSVGEAKADVTDGLAVAAPQTPTQQQQVGVGELASNSSVPAPDTSSTPPTTSII